MTQYTIEHHERPRAGASLYESNDIYVVVDEDDTDDVADLLHVQKRYGVAVRPSTKEEVDHVWALEVELDYDEPDVARHWPEEAGEVLLQIKDW